MLRRGVVNPVLPMSRSAQPAADWNTFFDVVREALTVELQASKIAPERWPKFTKAYPRTTDGSGYDHTFDVILYSIFDCKMAATSNDGSRVPNGLRVNPRPSPSKEGYIEVTSFWQEDLTVEFQILGKSNDDADQLVAWFHRFLMRSAALKYFHSHGIPYFRFIGRWTDAKSNDYGEQDLYVRTLRYLARITLQDVTDTKTLDVIHHSLSTDESAATDYEQH